MIYTKKLLHFNSAPIYIRDSSSNIDMIDNTFIHYHFDKQTYLAKKKTVIQKDTKGHEHARVFDISNDNLHVYPKKATKSLIFIKNDNGLKIDSNLKLAEAAAIVKFSNSSKLLVIGSDNGDIWLYDVSLKKIIYTLNPRADEISSIVFTKDDKLVAIGAYDKKIEVYNTKNWQLVCAFDVDGVIEDMVFSNDNFTLYAVHRDGNIIAFDIENKRTIYDKNLGQSWLSVIQTYKSDNYAIVGARDNSLLIVNLKTGKIVKSISLQNQGLNSAYFSKESLLMAFADGSMLVCDMQKHKDEALVAIKVQDYKKAKKLIDLNTLLYLDDTIQELHKGGKNVLQKIVTLIELSKVDEAISEAEPFLDCEDFNEKFNAYMSQKSEIAEFISAIESKNFVTAYKLAEEYEYIKELKKYQELEEFWYQCFTEAKNMIAKNPNDSAAKIRAKGKLQSFLNVSSKQESIKNLLENSMLFFKADTLVKEKKFIQFFQLCKENKFLEDTKIYNKVISISQLLMSNVSKAVVQKDYKNAILTARRLLSFTPVKDEATKHIKEISVIEKFNTATKEKDLEMIFKLVKENKFLENLLEYRRVMKNFEKINQDAKECAVSGDVEQTFSIIDEYLSIDYLKDDLAFTIKLAYLNSIPEVLQNTTIDWKKTFINYIELYGKDQELRNIAIENDVLNIYESISHYDNCVGYKSKAFKEEIVALAD